MCCFPWPVVATCDRASQNFVPAAGPATPVESSNMESMQVPAAAYTHISLLPGHGAVAPGALEDRLQLAEVQWCAQVGGMRFWRTVVP
jgi:hypothetical protein